MDKELRDELFGKGAESFSNSDFSQALGCYKQILSQDSSDWNAWYLAGICLHFLEDFPMAISYLEQALKLSHEDPSVYHSLGVAFEKNGDFSASLEALRKGRDLDPENVDFYISYGNTRKAMGDYEKAFGNYQSAFKVLASRIVKSMSNQRRNPVYPHPDYPFHLWMDCAIEGAMYLGVQKNYYIKGVEFPTGAMAEEELITHRHEGLLWIIREDSKGDMYQLYLPNYFNTFFVFLSRDCDYFYLLGFMSYVLGLLGRQKEAQEYSQEAEFFKSLFYKYQAS